MQLSYGMPVNNSTNGTCMKDAVTQLRYKYSIRLHHQQNLKYVERFLSVLCWLFDIQFQSSKKHKVHQQYTLSDVAKIDQTLAKLILSDAAGYGYNTSLIL